MFRNTKAYIESKIKELKLPFLEILVRKDRKVVFKYKYSIDKPYNPLLCMYSMSKPITTVALLQLLDQKKVSLDDEVSKYLDGYSSLHLINTKKIINKKITILHLLSMSSGLDYNLGRKSITNYLKKHKNASTIELCELFAKDGLNFIPGSKFQYSLSMDVVAAIIEKVSGMKFSSYVDKYIFKPLKMNHSTFINSSKLVNTTNIEYRNEHNKLIKYKRSYKLFIPNNKYESGGAGLISTVEDYSKFIDSLANTSPVIKDKYILTMNKLIIKDTPFNTGVSEYSKSSDEYGYGLGVRVRKKPSKYGIPKGEFGWDGATGSYSLCDKKNHISIVIGMNIQNWPSYIKDFHIALSNKIYKDINLLLK